MKVRSSLVVKQSFMWTAGHLHTKKKGCPVAPVFTLVITYQLRLPMSYSGTKGEMMSLTRSLFKGLMNVCACINVCILDRWKDKTL